MVLAAAGSGDDLHRRRARNRLESRDDGSMARRDEIAARPRHGERLQERKARSEEAGRADECGACAGPGRRRRGEGESVARGRAAGCEARPRRSRPRPKPLPRRSRGARQRADRDRSRAAEAARDIVAKLNGGKVTERPLRRRVRSIEPCLSTLPGGGDHSAPAGGEEHHVEAVVAGVSFLTPGFFVALAMWWYSRS